jgi:murein L,D-transpeptidase YcbB/YkuD
MYRPMSPSLYATLLLNLTLSIAALAEPNPFYPQLREALDKYQVIQQTSGRPSIAPGPNLQTGDVGSRVTELRRRLSASGDLPGTGVPGAGDRFDVALQRALRDFQSRHGLTEDGIVGPATLAALNTTLANRIAQMRVNLRRMKELALAPNGTTILINVPAYELLWIVDQNVTWRTRVQVGNRETPTPLFNSELTQIVVNPSWVVPRSIAVGEILPRIQDDPGYLTAQNMEVRDSDGLVVPENSIEWALLGPQQFPFQLVQKPCAINSLGRIKFIFPNDHSVYLHDTPQRALFERTHRALSHGCIRAQNPLDLARRLLQINDWDATDAESILISGQSHTINLTIKPFVAIVYWTAFVDSEGVVQFRDDIYGRDVRDLTSGPASTGTALPAPTSSQPVVPGSASSRARLIPGT